MKRIILLSILLVITNLIFSQDVAINPEFFTAKNMRIGVSLGADTSFSLESNDKSKLLFVSQVGKTNKDFIKFDKPAKNMSINLGLDFYSPSSVVGFFTEANVNFLEYQISPDDGVFTDSIASLNIEIPAYLKFRLGKVNRNSHFWVALGAGYSFALKGRQNSTQNDRSLGSEVEKSFLKNTIYTSSIIGYELIVPNTGSQGEEIYDRDTFRGLLYLKADYDLGNRINSDYGFNNASVLGNTSSPDIRFLRLSIGIKLLFRVSTLGKMVKEGLEQ